MFSAEISIESLPVETLRLPFFQRILDVIASAGSRKGHHLCFSPPFLPIPPSLPPFFPLSFLLLSLFSFLPSLLPFFFPFLYILIPLVLNKNLWLYLFVHQIQNNISSLILMSAAFLQKSCRYSNGLIKNLKGKLNTFQSLPPAFLITIFRNIFTHLHHYLPRPRKLLCYYVHFFHFKLKVIPLLTPKRLCKYI